MLGNPNCPHCGGAGFIYAESLLDGGRFCTCTFHALRLANMERIWKSLSTEKLIKSIQERSPLHDLVSSNTWITAPVSVFRKHFKAVALKQSTTWDARVRSDAEVLDSWFGRAKAEGVKIFDLEIADSKIEAIDIPDLVGPFPLVVLVLGVKCLPNKEAPNAILEAISYREHENLPTWVVDQPEAPILSVDHRCYSEALESVLMGWTHVVLDGEKLTKTRSPTHVQIQAQISTTVSEPESSLTNLLVGTPAKKSKYRKP